MLVSDHKTYTQKATQNLGLARSIREEIVKGSTVNDLAELTDAFGGAFPLSSKGNKKFRFFHNSVLYRSHYGNFTALHSMASKAGIDTETTKAEISQWLKSLSAVYAKKKINPYAEIENENLPFSSFFQSSGITYRRLFDTSKIKRIRHRAVGMMLHIIQDMYTMSHCKRNKAGEIVQFYYYGDQDRSNHKEFDHPQKGHIDMLKNECKKCLQSVLAKSSYNTTSVLKLCSAPERSGSETIS